MLTYWLSTWVHRNFELLIFNCQNVWVYVVFFLLIYWSTSCVCRDCGVLFPVQHDDLLRPSKWTVRVKSIASPPSVKSVIRSHFFHSRTANIKAADTFSDVFADVSMKLTTWNSWHQAKTSSGVISRSFIGTSF